MLSLPGARIHELRSREHQVRAMLEWISPVSRLAEELHSLLAEIRELIAAADTGARPH